jgi:hypothetical protein
MGFLFSVTAANDQANRLTVVGQEVARVVVDLLRQLAGWGDHDDTGALVLREFDLVQSFDCWDQECLGFAGTGLGGAQEVAAFEQVGDRPGLDVGHAVKIENFLYGFF